MALTAEMENVAIVNDRAGAMSKNIFAISPTAATAVSPPATPYFVDDNVIGQSWPASLKNILERCRKTGIINKDGYFAAGRVNQSFRKFRPERLQEQ